MYDTGLIYDVGMHRGEDTIYYLKKGFRVTAFEANPKLVAECKVGFGDQIASGQLTIVEGAIAPKNYGDRLTFYNPSLSVWGTVEPDWNERNLQLGQTSETIEVERVDFADALTRYGMPFFLKIDIEGVDQHVLSVMEQFGERPKHISIESEKVDFLKLQSELKQLCALGYNKFRVVQQQTIPGSAIIIKDSRGTPFRHTFPTHASGPFGDDLQQAWVSYEQAEETYRQIFRCYSLFGDRSFLRRTKAGWHLMDLVERLTLRSFPGWYDTHATQ